MMMFWFHFAFKSQQMVTTHQMYHTHVLLGFFFSLISNLKPHAHYTALLSNHFHISSVYSSLMVQLCNVSRLLRSFSYPSRYSRLPTMSIAEASHFAVLCLPRPLHQQISTSFFSPSAYPLARSASARPTGCGGGNPKISSLDYKVCGLVLPLIVLAVRTHICRPRVSDLRVRP